MKSSTFGFLTLVVMLTAITAFSSAEESPEDLIKKDRKRIEGTWRAVAIEIDGNKAKEEDVKKLTVVNGEDGSWSLNSEGRELYQGTTTLDPTKKPKTIDITLTTGPEKGNCNLGIYEVEENTRKLCFSPIGNQRPTEFSTTPGSGYIFVVFERVKTK